MDGPNNGLILYHYSFSPYARRVIWYLAFRGIDYAECKQPPTLPRPDLKALGVTYRRIPLMSIGRDVYADTRIILSKLEELFPEGRLGAVDSDGKALEKLLESWAIDSGLFVRASQLIPPDMPLLKDPKFSKDREDFSGRPWSREKILENRPEAMVHVRNAFHLLETTLLADNRDWILNTKNPSLADIEAIWPIDWLIGLTGALPRELFNEQHFPKVYAWVTRFNTAYKEARAAAPKPMPLKGNAALQRISQAAFAEVNLAVDTSDPLHLVAGDEVEIWPTDSGFKHRDRGRLLKLSPEEIVIAVQSETGKEIHLHTPRNNFRIASLKGASKL